MKLFIFSTSRKSGGWYDGYVICFANDEAEAIKHSQEIAGKEKILYKIDCVDVDSISPRAIEIWEGD